MTFGEVEPLVAPDERIPGVPEDTQYLADRLDRIADAVEEVQAATIRQEKPNPAILEILFLDGVAAATPFGQFTTTTRYRVEGIILFVSGTTTLMNLVVGTRRYRLRAHSGQSLMYLPFPIVIDNGVDIFGECGTVQAAGQIGGFYVIAYPDTAFKA